MGCDIHTYVEVNQDGAWQRVDMASPFERRNYGLFGFLANVRNYSKAPTIAMPKGFPEDASQYVRAAYEEWAGDAHTPSWLTLAELLAINYDAPFEDCRVERQLAPNLISGAETCEPGEGEMTTLRRFLGEAFFNDLDCLVGWHDEDASVRLVFWFDN